MNSVRSNNLSLKYLRFTQSGSKDIGIGHMPIHTGIPLLIGHVRFPALQAVTFHQNLTNES